MVGELLPKESPVKEIAGFFVERPPVNRRVPVCVVDHERSVSEVKVAVVDR